MATPKRRRITLPASARTASVERHVPALRTAVAHFFRAKAEQIAAAAETAYAKALKSDEDKVRRILADLGLDDWGDLADLVQSALVAVFEEGGRAALEALDLSQPGFFDRLNTEALAYAKQRGAELVGMRYNAAGELVTNPNAEWAINESTRDGLRDLIGKAFEDGLSPEELSNAIRDAYEFSGARADLISRTELAFAHTQGELDAMKASGAVTGKSLLLSDSHDQDDECNDAADEGVVDLDADIDPPLHPNCECTLVYEVAEEESEAA